MGDAHQPGFLIGVHIGLDYIMVQLPEAFLQALT